MVLRIHNSQHKQCRAVFRSLSAHIYDFLNFIGKRNRIGGKAPAGKTLFFQKYRFVLELM